MGIPQPEAEEKDVWYFKDEDDFLYFRDFASRYNSKVKAHEIVLFLEPFYPYELKGNRANLFVERAKIEYDILTGYL